MAQYNYGSSNPFDDRTAGVNYSNNYVSSPSYGGNDTGYGQNVEMAPLAQNGSAFGQQAPAGGNSLFKEVDQISRDIEEVEGQLKLLKEKQKQLLLDTGRNASQDLEAMNGQIMSELRTLTGQLRNMKSVYGNDQVQIKRIERRLKDVTGQYQNIESDFRRALRENMERQYRIVRPDATPQEVEQHIENPDTQVFAQALMTGNRMGNAQSVHQAVTARHEAIQKIESQIIELSQLFQQMNELVEEQEVAVANIEQKAEEVVEDLGKGNEQVEVAIKSAKSRNRKKWWCLLVSIIIIVVIAVVILVIKFINGGFGGSSSPSTNKTSKRDFLDLEHTPFIAGGKARSISLGTPFSESDALEKRQDVDFWGANSNAVKIGANFEEQAEKRDGGKFWSTKSDAIVLGAKFEEARKREAEAEAQGGKFRGPSAKREVEAQGGKFRGPSLKRENVGGKFRGISSRDYTSNTRVEFIPSQ